MYKKADKFVMNLTNRYLHFSHSNCPRGDIHLGKKVVNLKTASWNEKVKDLVKNIMWWQKSQFIWYV